MVVLCTMVIFGSRLEMGVREDAQFLEQLQGAIDGRLVYAGQTLLDPSHEKLRRDVTLRPHDLADDRPSLRGHPVAAAPKSIESFFCGAHFGAWNMWAMGGSSS